jgi:hypothetical protein
MTITLKAYTTTIIQKIYEILNKYIFNLDWNKETVEASQISELNELKNKGP